MFNNQKIYDEAMITELTDKLSRIINERMEQLQQAESSPYINGIDGLAEYLGVGLSLAQELKNKKEIAYSQRGRQIWFKKSDIEKFMQRNRA